MDESAAIGKAPKNQNELSLLTIISGKGDFSGRWYPLARKCTVCVCVFGTGTDYQYGETLEFSGRDILTRPRE